MPQLLFDENAAKKATNLTIDNDLFSRTRELDINLSDTLENASIEAERANWRKNNRKAISALNALADRHGLFSDAYRGF